MNWRAYLLPGLVFQSVIIGGGYATGRELVTFFLALGPLPGLLGLLVAGLVFAAVMATAYEFARQAGAHDYRTFCRRLLGPAWVLYEVAYLALVVLILAVVGSAAGELASDALGLPPATGTVGMMLLVGTLTFYGSALIGRVLAGWSVLLYAVYLLLFALTLTAHGDTIAQSLREPPAQEGSWALSGTRYAAYNISLPAVLFCMTLLTTRRQAVGAGIMTGVIAIVPALLFYTAMLAYYPAIVAQPVPALFLMAQLDLPWVQALFQLVVFGTFVETGAGVLHAINERIDVQAQERGRALPRWARPTVAGSLLLLSIYGATTFGIVDLIARGYGFLSWVFIAVLIAPLMTIGLWRILLRPTKEVPCNASP
ncbi:MAG: YkvI family membrane protein [Pseudohaliea sp.]